MAVSAETRKMLDEVVKEELCVSRAEALRRLVAHWRRTRGDSIRQKGSQVPINADAGIYARDLYSFYKFKSEII